MNLEDYPLVLNHKDVMEIMRCGKDKAYELMRRQDFPVIRDGRKLFVPRDAFFTWLNEMSWKENFSKR